MITRKKGNTNKLKKNKNREKKPRVTKKKKKKNQPRNSLIDVLLYAIGPETYPISTHSTNQRERGEEEKNAIWRKLIDIINPTTRHKYLI